MPSRETNYLTIKIMCEKQVIVSLNDIFRFVSRTRIATDIGMKVTRLNKLIIKVEMFVIEDLLKIARLCQMDIDEIYALWKAEYLIQSQKKKY